MVKYGHVLTLPAGSSTIVADFDFETYSEAGFVWNPATNKWRCPRGADKKGLRVVGAAAYAEHPTCEVLSLAYDLKDGLGRRHWVPGQPAPLDLFAHIAAGRLLEAWNVAFEAWVWANVCVPRYGWPELPPAILRCAMAKARAHALPGSLDLASTVLDLRHKKDADGKRLLDRFSIPRNPTKADPRRRIRPSEDPVDGPRLYAYNERDIMAEAEASARIPDLPPFELAFWQADQAINRRGVAIDRPMVEACIAIVEQALAAGNAELCALTGGTVEATSEVQKLRGWLGAHGVHLHSLDEEAVEEALRRPGLPPHCERALRIRQAVGSASVKKVFAMANQATAAGRLHDLFSYHAARTGRATGNGPQPQNLPKAGPQVRQCDKAAGCGRYYGKTLAACPHCGTPEQFSSVEEWAPEVAEDALAAIASRSLEWVEYVFGAGNALPVVSGCLRGLFVAADGHDLICSDYSAIEAVVLAMLAGEKWREEVFRTHGKIYEASASMITGVPLEEFFRHKKETGHHHPHRNGIGKFAELASGFQGWVGAWKAFGAGEHMSDEEIKRAILKWRLASPAIVEFWGGQFRGRPWEPGYRQEYYGLEGAAVQAILSPGVAYPYRDITYQCDPSGAALYCRLPSGRLLTYHHPQLRPSDRDAGYSLSYEGYNTNPKNGPVGWIRMDTWGGRLTENVVQAVARDVLAHAIVNLERAGYPVVLHIHDEVVAEVPAGWGTIEEFESILGTLPVWCAHWPVKAAGGWRGRRYRKD